MRVALPFSTIMFICNAVLTIRDVSADTFIIQVVFCGLSCQNIRLLRAYVGVVCLYFVGSHFHGISGLVLGTCPQNAKKTRWTLTWGRSRLQRRPANRLKGKVLLLVHLRRPVVSLLHNREVYFVKNSSCHTLKCMRYN